MGVDLTPGVGPAWRRAHKLRVALLPARDCWVSLPGPLVNQLFSANLPLPVVLRLVPLAPSGGSSAAAPPPPPSRPHTSMPTHAPLPGTPAAEQARMP